VGVLAVTAATLVGAWLARRRAQQQHLWFGAAGGALAVVALVHLLPDAWAGAQRAGAPSWLVPTIVLGTFGANLAIGRQGCTCGFDEAPASGAQSAAAIALHRILEGATLALTGITTAVALLAHALGEGMAIGALLRAQPRRLSTWLALMCLGPAIGALTANAIPHLETVEPLLLATANGILANTARVSFAIAFPVTPSG